MMRKVLGLSLTAFLLVIVSIGEVQQAAGKVPQIGFLTAGSQVTDAPRIEAFRQGLRELGYVEGKSINIEVVKQAAPVH
jgi:putative ABC transport system substrate-binding protein